jgi:hypothetical protein
MTKLWSLLLISAAAAAAQTACPYAVPSSIPLWVPRSLPPGSRPYVRDAAAVWVFCGTAPAGQGTLIEVSTTDPLTFSSLSPFDPKLASYGGFVFAESDLSSALPTLSITFLSTALDPAANSQPYTVTIHAQGGASILLPVTVNVTDSPFLDFSETALTFELRQGASPQEVDSQITDEYVWFTNNPSLLPFTVTPQSSGWLSASPTNGTGYTQIAVRADPGSLAPGSYFGSLVVTAPGAVNSPATIPVRLVVTATSGAQSGAGSRKPSG